MAHSRSGSRRSQRQSHTEVSSSSCLSFRVTNLCRSFDLQIPFFLDGPIVGIFMDCKPLLAAGKKNQIFVELFIVQLSEPGQT